MLLGFLIFLFVASSMAALLVGALYPRLARGASLDRRVERISAASLLTRRAGTTEESPRKRSVGQTLREAEDKQKTDAKRRGRPTLLQRTRQADLSWNKNTYYLVCAGTGLAAFLLFLSMARLGMLPAVGFGISAGLMLPHWYVNFRRSNRFKRFASYFPNAIDIIVRGVKSGLPLGDCLKIIAAEAQEPVKSEFRVLIEDVALGMPLDQAVQRLPERIPLSEASFFAITIAMQSTTGGNLSEALGNLSNVLRDRKKMRSKIKAVSGEAKASAGIIGALPVIVAGLVYLTSPAYMALLFTTQTGHIVLAACAFWMLIGTLVMRKMINFNF